MSTYLFSAQCSGITRCGLPHSEISGSKVASTYPEHIVGNHVLHRLLVPRHPPYALRNFNQKSLSIQIDTTCSWRTSCKCFDKLVFYFTEKLTIVKRTFDTASKAGRFVISLYGRRVAELYGFAPYIRSSNHLKILAHSFEL